MALATIDEKRNDKQQDSRWQRVNWLVGGRVNSDTQRCSSPNFPEILDQSLNNALAEKQQLLDDIDYLEGSLRDSQASHEHLNVQIDELKGMVKELNQRPDYGHLREEVELLKGYLDLFRHKEELFIGSLTILQAPLQIFNITQQLLFLSQGIVQT